MKNASALFLILLVVAIVIGGPLATIWSLNTLFGLTIAYTFKTWLAALFLGGLMSKSASSSSSK